MDPAITMQILTTYTILSILCTLAAAAFYVSHMWHKTKAVACIKKTLADDFFVTARGVGTAWQLMWSWHATYGGSWLLSGFGMWGYFNGVVGVIGMALAFWVATCLFAVVARHVFTVLPKEPSFPAAVRTLYGPVVEAYAFGIMALTEWCLLVLEYNSISNVFFEIFHVPKYITLVVHGLFTLLYTTVGGALVGLITAQLHGLAGWVCTATLAYYLASCAPSAASRPPQEVVLYGFNKQATIAMVTKQLYTLCPSFLFQSAMWQKAICADSNRSNVIASLTGMTSVAIIAVFFGMAGVLSFWTDFAAHRFFPYFGSAYLLHVDPARQGSHSIHGVTDARLYWFGATLLIYAAIGSKASTESLTDGLLSTVYGSMRLRKHRLLASRLVVLALSAIAMYASQDAKFAFFKFWDLVLMITATLAVPLFLSICIPHLVNVATPAIILLSSASGLLALAGHGLQQALDTGKHPTTDDGRMQALRQGLEAGFYSPAITTQQIMYSLVIPFGTYALLMSIQLTRVWYFGAHVHQRGALAASSRMRAAVAGPRMQPKHWYRRASAGNVAPSQPIRAY